MEPYPSQIDDIVKMTKLLLDQGAAVNCRSSTGFTPFMYACSSGNKDIVELLLNLSAIDSVDNSGNTVIIIDSFHCIEEISFRSPISRHYTTLSKIDM